MMSSRSRRGAVGMVVMVLTCATWLGTSIRAQAPSSASAADAIESDPIKCWWKTDRSAVYIGERFTVAVTCRVVETSRIKVVPAQNQLEPTAVQIPPFEVLGGARSRDIQAPPWRYFQYEYTVRLIGDAFFGQDVDIPSIKVTYNIESAGRNGTQGRDQMYGLSPLPMRILSLVPKQATDIRDVPSETFPDIEARLFRATAELMAAGILFGGAVLLLGLAVVRMIGRSRQRVPTVARPLRPAVVLRGCLRGIGRLELEVEREGWTPELTGRALTSLRIAGAVALGRPLAQTVVDDDVPGREGQLVLRKGLLRPKRALISARTTPDAITAHLSNGRRPSPQTAAILEEIQDSLRVFSAARYGRDGHLDTAALDAALGTGRSAIQRLRLTTLWPIRTARALRKSAAAMGATAWSR